jgi:two-component system nitrogen regulation sensor histidine kinase GlnL
MNKYTAFKKVGNQSLLGSDVILNSLGCAVLAINKLGQLIYANNAAEQLLKNSANQLIGSTIDEIFPGDGPVPNLIRQTFKNSINVSEYGITLESPKIEKQLVNIQVSILSEINKSVLVNIIPRNISDKIDKQLTHRNAVRSVTAMAEMLAHEVKNPLSGIRGAAQLLEQNSDPEDRKLTQLICDETDRICDLLNRIEIFSDLRPLTRGPVNVHQVLKRVRDISITGFAKTKNIMENYDPSLPLVYGHFDQLVQIFLNLFKNAAEATPVTGGEIYVSTSYVQGIRLAVPGLSSTQLPLMIEIEDNGHGIPEDMQHHLFEPFVTGKPHGSGIGLALTAKMVEAHSGIIEFESEPGRTIFRVFLPKNIQIGE